MEVKKLIEAAILSSLFVVCSIIFISTGLMYAFYLDVVVPVFIVIIYLRCDFKYTTLAMITCVSIVGLVLGDIVSALWMSQSMLIGLVCGYILIKKTKIFDDILILSVFSSVIIVLIDIYISKLTGFGLIESANESVKIAKEILGVNVIPQEIINISIYISIAAIPLGTALICYLSSMIVANKVKSLKGNAKDKFDIIKNIKKNPGSMYNSNIILSISVLYLILTMIMDVYNIKVGIVHLNMLIQVTRYILYYFVLKDLILHIKTYVYFKTRSVQNLRLLTFLIIMSLFMQFRFTFWMMVIIVYIYIPLRQTIFK